MFEFDFRNIIVLLSLGIHLSLLWVLIRYGRNTQGGKAYTAAILAIAGWILPMTVYRTHFLDETLLWARVLYIMATFTSLTFLYFSVVFPKRTKVSTWIQGVFLLETVALIAALIHPTAIIRDVVIMSGSEDVIIWGPLYPWFVNHISGLFLLGFILLFIKGRKESGKRRRQVMAILIGYFLGANLAMVTNLILPWFGYFELNWLGQFFSTLVAVFTTYAILRLKLLNIRIIATELFIILLNFALFVRLVLSTSPTETFVNSVLFVSIILISFLLVKSVTIELKQKDSLIRLTNKLKKTNDQLKEFDKLKTEFLSIASHQLRTPLSIIKGYTSLLEEGAYGKMPKKAKQVLLNIEISNERLVKLVDEFLDVSRLEQGRTKYSFEKMDLEDTIDGIVTELQEKANKKNIHIKVEKATRNPNFIADEEKLRHGIYNYVDNAIKYSQEQSTVIVRMAKEKGGYSVSVHDTGVGMDDMDLKNIFQKFYRSAHVIKDIGGNGLGLYVVKQFIEAHGGYVWGKSNGVNKGSEFGVWIPNSPKGKIYNQIMKSKEKDERRTSR